MGNFMSFCHRISKFFIRNYYYWSLWAALWIPHFLFFNFLLKIVIGNFEIVTPDLKIIKLNINFVVLLFLKKFNVFMATKVNFLKFLLQNCIYRFFNNYNIVGIHSVFLKKILRNFFFACIAKTINQPLTKKSI